MNDATLSNASHSDAPHKNNHNRAALRALLEQRLIALLLCEDSSTSDIRILAGLLQKMDDHDDRSRKLALAERRLDLKAAAVALRKSAAAERIRQARAAEVRREQAREAKRLKEEKAEARRMRAAEPNAEAEATAPAPGSELAASAAGSAGISQFQTQTQTKTPTPAPTYKFPSRPFGPGIADIEEISRAA